MKGIRAINSRALVISRVRSDQIPDTYGVPPVNTTPPELYEGLVGAWDNANPGKFGTAAGLTLRAWNGIWDTTDGATTVVGEFVNDAGDVLPGAVAVPTPFAPDLGGDGMALLVTEEHVSAASNIWFRVRAQRGSHTGTIYSQTYVLPDVYTGKPFVTGGTNYTMVGDLGPGATLTKPTYNWTDVAGMEPLTIAGQWYKNGVPTGVTTSTYSDTAEGDVVWWRETATNQVSAVGDTDEWTTPEYRHPFSIRHTSAYPKLVYDGVMDSILPRIAGKPGGATSMNLFSTKNYATAAYVRNTAMWCHDLRHQLTGCVVHKTWGTGADNTGLGSYGGVLITPRHVLYCHHAFPFAANTYWPSNSVPCLLRFVTADNQMVEVEQIHQATWPYYGMGWDLCVAVLARDVEADGLHVAPLLDTRLSGLPARYTYLDGCRDIFTGSNPAGCLVSVSQSGRNRSNYVPQSVIDAGMFSDYPVTNDTMLYIGEQGYCSTKNTGGVFNNWAYDVFNGDSGTPFFLLCNDVFYTAGVHTAGNFVGVTVATDTGTAAPGLPPGVPTMDTRWLIEYLIAAADAKAIALGRLAAPTGLLPTWAIPSA